MSLIGNYRKKKHLMRVELVVRDTRDVGIVHIFLLERVGSTGMSVILCHLAAN